MIRLSFASSIVLVAVSCGGSSDDGGSGGSAGTSGATGNGGAAGTSGTSGADGGGSAGQSGSAGQAGRGGTTGSGGTAGRGGSSGTGGRRVCGGIAGLTCNESEWCDYADHCGAGDMQGVCTPKPGACTKDCPGVCGCDGNRYCNACLAQQQGIDVSPTASCR
jgi:hypothetical protein